MNFRDFVNHKVTDMINNVSGVSQDVIDRANEPKVITPGMPELVRKAAAEGAVLLKNYGVLPFASGTKLSLFSRVSESWFYVGYGSGGDVNRPYEVSLADGIRTCEYLEINEELADLYKQWGKENPINHGVWGRWPYYYPDMPLTDAIVSRAANVSDAAVVTIGRSAGEDRDNALTKGSYYLTDDEMRMLYLTTKFFDKVVVLLNVGGIIDMSWVERFGARIGAIMYVWQGGMESGNAVADLLCGNVCPSGKLTDSIGKEYDDYITSANFGGKDYDYFAEDIYVGYRYFETFAKDKVLYPFGYGLSYSSFEYSNAQGQSVDGGFEISVKVKNTGNYNAKESVQLYLEKPCGKLGNPSRELVGFAKTKELAPKKSEVLEIFVPDYLLASYDDCGDTGNKFAYVIEAGEYKFHLGSNIRDTEQVFTFYQNETELFVQHRQACAPQVSFETICARETASGRTDKIKNSYSIKYDLGARIINNFPEDIEQTGDKGIKLDDVKSGKNTLEEFVAQLSLDELEAITRGDYKMDSPLGAKGNAGAFGGVLQSLRDKGVKPVITTDGPSGIRLRASCSLIPIGTLLACTYNTELVEELYTAISNEMKDRGSDVLLAPGLNIHRNPLCGRNFEYYSEDPFVSGKMAAAAVKGVQSTGLSACPKHFACNIQEHRRTMTDARVSERALRQIYLKGFEICVKEAEPKNIMTSYNKVNGVYSHYNYDLCTTILRGEWGYKGNVMTDWWMKSQKSPEFENVSDQAYRVRAQVDVLMPGGDRITNGKPDGTLLKSYGKPLGITLGEMQRSAMNVLRLVMDIKM